MWSHQLSSTKEESNSIKCDREAEKEMGIRKEEDRGRRKKGKREKKR